MTIMSEKSKILIVDDDPLIRQMLRMLFEEDVNRYEVLDAPGVVEGLEAAAAAVPHLIVVDIMMSRLSGYDFIVGIRSDPALKHIPIMVYSAKQPPVERECLKLGANAYFQKPLDLEIFRRKAKELLGHPN